MYVVFDALRGGKFSLHVSYSSDIHAFGKVVYRKFVKSFICYSKWSMLILEIVDCNKSLQLAIYHEENPFV